MPYPNYHSARIRQPLPQGTAVFATKSIAPGITIILQRGKDSKSMEVQAYRFSKNQFTSTEAKAWLKSHNIKYISFESASSIDKESLFSFSKELSSAIL